MNRRIMGLGLRRTELDLCEICLAGSCGRLPWSAKEASRPHFIAKDIPKHGKSSR